MTSTVVRRASWLALFLIHFSALCSAFASMFDTAAGERVATFARLLLLILSAIFFAFKIADVRWLRFNGGWRSAVAMTLAVAVLHVGVLRKARDQMGPLAPNPITILFAGTLLGSEVVRRGWPIRFIRAALAHTPNGVSQRFPSYSPCLVRDDRPPEWLTRVDFGGPRAPPLR